MKRMITAVAAALFDALAGFQRRHRRALGLHARDRQHRPCEPDPVRVIRRLRLRHSSGDRGSGTYANFAYAAPRSGAWLRKLGPAADRPRGGAPYDHSMTSDTVKVITPTNVTFSGQGLYRRPVIHLDRDRVHRDGVVAFCILYTGTSAGYFFDATGQAADMSGTARYSLLRPDLTWTISPSFAHEVLSYTADVTGAVVTRATSGAPGTASFGFTIPAGFPGLSGLDIVINVVDGGTPGTNGDKYGHGVGTCGDSTTSYVTTSGNLVVH